LESILGISIETDRTTKEKSATKYARLLIEMPLAGPFPDYIDYVNDWEVVVRQQVIYEWKPIQCNHCNMMGHKEVNCRKKHKVRKEWRVVHQGGGNKVL